MRRPLQVYVEDEDLARLERWAAERGWTKSEAIRAAVRALVRSGTSTRSDPILDLAGMVQSGLPEDTSTRFEEYLTATFVAERSPAYGRARPGRARTKKRK